MILYVKGNLFQSPAQVLVNTVNTVGVMGKGIALDFKRLFPEMYQQYRDLCERKQFVIGKLWLYKSPNKWVLNFPTKKHWREPSQVEYIEAGLKKFVDSYIDLGIHSIAFSPLGCGNGQLDFETQIKPLMETYLRQLPIEVFIYPEKNSAFVEHLHPHEMKQWLHTEPTLLPFAEVWDDLIQLLKTSSSFTTLVHHKPFEARFVETPPHIKILAGGQKYTIHYEMLMAFWQQLRTHGFSMRYLIRRVSLLVGNLGSRKAHIFSTADELEHLPWQKIYHTGWIDFSAETNIVFHRHAEAIIPQTLDLESLRYIYCRSEAERETLLHVLSPSFRKRYQHKIVSTTSSTLFYRQHTFVEKVRLSSNAVVRHV